MKIDEALIADVGHVAGDSILSSIGLRQAASPLDMLAYSSGARLRYDQL